MHTIFFRNIREIQVMDKSYHEHVRDSQLRLAAMFFQLGGGMPRRGRYDRCGPCGSRSGPACLRNVRRDLAEGGDRGDGRQGGSLQGTALRIQQPPGLHGLEHTYRLRLQDCLLPDLYPTDIGHGHNTVEGCLRSTLHRVGPRRVPVDSLDDPLRSAMYPKLRNGHPAFLYGYYS